MCLYIWELSQTSNQAADAYTKAILIAANEEIAKFTHPSGRGCWNGQKWQYEHELWVNPKDVSVDFLGVAAAYREAEVLAAIKDNF